MAEDPRSEAVRLARAFVQQRRELGDGFWPEPDRSGSGRRSRRATTKPTAVEPETRKPEPVYAASISAEPLRAGEALDRPIEELKAENVTLEEFQAAIKGCLRCPLGQTRTNFVFGSGNPDADLMFVGEAPGEDEDLQGLPFIGRAGQLLTKMIEAMQLRREDVYIANVLKCRPPGNRTPLPSEMATCQPYLDRQIELIRPKIICALGRVAAQALLNTGEGLGRLRGVFHDYKGIKVLVTYHPAALLRNPQWKAQSWDDLQKVRFELDGTILRPKKA